MAKKAVYNVVTRFGAVDATKKAVKSATDGLKKVGKAGEQSGNMLGMFTSKMRSLSGLLSNGAAFGLGAGGLVGALGAIGLDAAKTSTRIDELIGRLGKLGDTHGETVRALAFRHGEGFIQAAGELARVSTPEEFADAAMRAGAVDLFGSSSIPFNEGSSLAATIAQSFEGVGIVDALESVATLYREMGGERFGEITKELERSAETLGDSRTVSIQEFLGLVRAANTQIGTPDALGEFLEDVGKELTNPDAEIARLFRENQGNLLATLQSAAGNKLFEKELGGLARTQLRDVVMELERTGDTMEINRDALLELAQDATTLSDAIKLAKNSVTESAADLVSGPVEDLKNALLILSDNAHLVSGDLGDFGRIIVSLGGTVRKTSDVFSNTVYALGGLRDFINDDLAERTRSAELREGGTAAQVRDIRMRIEELTDTLNDPRARRRRSRRSVQEEIDRLNLDLQILQPGLFDTNPSEPGGGSSAFSYLQTPRGRLDDVGLANMRQLNAISPPAMPQAGPEFAQDSWLRRYTDEVKSGLAVVAEEVKMNTVNRDDNTQQILEEQRLQIQGAC